MTDEALIEQFWQKDERAVEALQEKYGGWCSAIARQFLSDDRDVEECLNDVYMAVWKTIPPTRPDHFKGWLGAVVRHRAIALGRENRRRPETVDEAALELAACLPCPGDAHSETLAKELGRAVSDFLRTQKAGWRTAFLRRYWYLDTVEETAAFMGWTVSKTKTVLFRTRNSLWDYLNKEGLL